jgi:hypothetical protein
MINQVSYVTAGGYKQTTSPSPGGPGYALLKTGGCSRYGEAGDPGAQRAERFHPSAAVDDCPIQALRLERKARQTPRRPVISNTGDERLICFKCGSREIDIDGHCYALL